MIILPPIPELSLVGVISPGEPNKENIVLYVHKPINLARFGILLGYKIDQVTQPLNNHFFWLTDIHVDAGTWIFVYTGSGTPRFTKTQGTEEPAYVLHWNQPNVLFSNQDTVPIIFSMSSFNIGNATATLNLPAKQQ